MSAQVNQVYVYTKTSVMTFVGHVSGESPINSSVYGASVWRCVRSGTGVCADVTLEHS